MSTVEPDEKCCSQLESGSGDADRLASPEKDSGPIQRDEEGLEYTQVDLAVSRLSRGS